MKALVVHKDGKDAPARHELVKFDQLDQLPAAGREAKAASLPQSVVNVELSTLNYKDGLVAQGRPGVATFPIVPGIDFVGTIESCAGGSFQRGDWVVLTGHYAGQQVHGGYAEKCSIPTEWLIPLPKALSPKDAMIIGTAGFTAMQSVMALERAGCLRSKDAKVLVSGASGGVGSTAIAILKQLGFSNIVASTGRVEENGDWLRSLGANEVIGRIENARPLAAESYDAGIDTVGGQVLAGMLSQIKYGGAVSACGVAGGPKVPTTVFPFILRGVSLLGIDSVQLPMGERTEVWKRLETDFPRAYLEATTAVKGLEDVQELSEKILDGKISGRVLISPKL
ncbi:Probable acrylyl-CoA reductase AcuI (Acryloyl-coenzyme A reductase AcuI) [Durusdinium trenchii]|uniref:Probable acrylyl-CoA reductase AcuI (Acryloyl-coenzyme A reductase AcuI) n=1 Tax=Durusdinium trenchii TaxID=1381693 RepID=A0ABP0JZA3_9DINO